MLIEVLVMEPQGVRRCERPWVPGLTAHAVLVELGVLIHEDLAIGVYGRRITLGTVLAPEDRLEVYLPLKLSPTERRKRQAEGKKLRRPARSPKSKAAS
jgi:hypothetical protein